MKLNKRWTIAAIVLAALSILFLTQVNTVRAVFDGVHAFKVYLRVETEIMQKNPARQYYEALFWKHNDELMQIMRAHPEHNEKLAGTLILFVPELEALLDGNGDDAYLTTEHVEAVKSELDWYSAVGSQALQEDIQRERERLPLDDLVGMSMNEALAFINSKLSSETLDSKTLVLDSDGKWAYYVHENVYFEYPSQYTVQISESQKEYVYFIPSTGMPEYWHPCVMKVKVWTVPSSENTDVHTWYSQENVLWEEPVQNAEFLGLEFVRSWANSSPMDVHAFLYNQQYQLAVEIWVLVFEAPPQNDATDYRQLVNQRYEYFQHMVDNLRIEKP